MSDAPEQLPAPRVVCPFSVFDDCEFSGADAEEVARNAGQSVDISLQFHQPPRRLAQSREELRELFRGHQLTKAAAQAMRWVAEEFERARRNFLRPVPVASKRVPVFTKRAGYGSGQVLHDKLPARPEALADGFAAMRSAVLTGDPNA